MAMFSWGNRPKPKPFGFIPRYYDEAKEDLEARLAKYDKEADSAELMKHRIKSGFARKGMYSGDSYRQQSRKSNIRLLAIIIVLAMTAVLIMQSEGVLKMVEQFNG